MIKKTTDQTKCGRCGYKFKDLENRVTILLDDYSGMTEYTTICERCQKDFIDKFMKEEKNGR